MARPKILFFTEIETPYRQPILAKLCDRPEWDLRIVVLANKQKDRDWKLDKPWTLSSRTDFLKGFQLGSWNAHSFFINWGVKKYLQDQKPSLVFISGYSQPAFWTVWRFCQKNRVPYITVSESHGLKKRGVLISLLKNHWVKGFYQNASAHLTTGTASKEFISGFGAKPHEVFFFPNTIHVEDFATKVQEFRPSRKELRSLLQIDENPVILYVGHLAPWKGVDVLIKSFVALRRKGIKVSLLLIGSGPMKKALKKLIPEKFQSQVHFSGFVQPQFLPKYYAASDLFVLPSRHETWGVVLIEAMASKLPVICSNVVGARQDLLMGHETGFSFPNESSEILSKHLETLVRNPRLREQMGEKAFQKAKEWSWDRAIEGFEKAVETALKEKS